MLNDGRLIDLVHTYPFLYDRKRSDFKDVRKKDSAWEEIGALLGYSAEDCKKRWSYLREKYGREKNTKPSGSGASNSWEYYESMKWLDPYIQKRKSKTSCLPNESQPVIIYSQDITYDESQLIDEVVGAASQGTGGSRWGSVAISRPESGEGSRSESGEGSRPESREGSRPESREGRRPESRDGIRAQNRAEIFSPTHSIEYPSINSPSCSVSSAPSSRKRTAEQSNSNASTEMVQSLKDMGGTFRDVAGVLSTRKVEDEDDHFANLVRAFLRKHADGRKKKQFKKMIFDAMTDYSDQDE